MGRGPFLNLGHSRIQFKHEIGYFPDWHVMITNTRNIQRHFQKLGNIRHNTTIVANSDLLDIPSIENGILVVFASWSGPAILNFIDAIKLLNNKNYKGQIIVVDIDDLNPDFQVATFGDVCHGWAEIFIINNGRIIQKFLGATCFEKFKASVDGSTGFVR